MEHHRLFALSILALTLLATASAQLRTDYYKDICPNVEQYVRTAVTQKFLQTFVTAPATLRLFFHDCFVKGCDASVLLYSPSHNAEMDHPDDISLAGDGFDTVAKAKAAVDQDPMCTNKVSCADILALATRDVIALTGGPSYKVEVGRLDGRISTKASVQHNLPKPYFNLDQLNALFSWHGLTQTDMIALSGGHTIGFAHCSKFMNRLYKFSRSSNLDPTLNWNYARQLQAICPMNVDSRIAVQMDQATPQIFDNAYYKNLQKGMGLFTSDQSLYTDPRSRDTVNLFASNTTAFYEAFVTAITKLGRVGVKTTRQGEIRRDCSKVN
ncbi:PREDICTED: peroxidase 16-like [Nelumbo nucifera]|uniref:Peroxidase n=2 Tax=Nelumbo nucifera TaxID=4432 RepID=A0A1U7ZG55_NELNU|nr:PREDICTED: peroxidase 16-like [Nelumbo nucifera]DAD45782.1 TPA_asm: hypothetical protein HUJ06_004012 [Nelumbo nucifera]